MARLVRFVEDRRGNVAMLFGLMLLPMLMLIGVGVDYSRISSHEHELQKVVDNAARSVGNLGNRRSDAARQIEAMINANSGRDSAQVKISIHRDKLRIDARDEIDTPLLSTIGQEKSEITASIELDASRVPGSDGKGSKSAIDRKQFDQALDAQFDEALKQVGMKGNLDRLSPTQRERLKRQMKDQLRQLGVRFK